MSNTVIEICGHEIAVSNADKVLFPSDRITKGELVDYYRRIGDVVVPHYCGRPLTMQRFPDGIGKSGFIQKEAPDYFPDWIAQATLAKRGGTVRHAVVDDAATLVYLADQGVITPHLGLSRIDAVEMPDRLIFDLDPSDDDFSKVQFAAQLLRDVCNKVEVATFVQTTGSRGLHVVVPLDRSATFEDVRSFAQSVASELTKRHGDALTVETRKAKRGDRVFIDTARNAYGQTAVAPYAVRPLAGAPVATPLDWSEALSKRMNPRRYGIKNVFRRLANTDDPWRGIDAAAAPASDLGGKIEY